MGMKDTAIYAESWNVAYRFSPRLDILKNKQRSFHVIPNSIRYWAADPMIFEHDGAVCIFAELYDYTKCRGVIGVSVFDGKGFGKWQPIIVEDTHLSYPFVFEHDGKVYMIPESSAAKKLTLYEAVKFPFAWKRSKTILEDIQLVDTTLMKTESGFFGYTQELGDVRKDLQIVLDDALDVVELSQCPTQKPETSRCGGQIFGTADKYVRVCQDCADDYGVALYFKTIDKMTDQEERSERITPQELSFDKKIYLNGMHTYSATEQIEVIDIKTRRFNLMNLFFRTVNKAKHHRN